jgi:hypothetical protein
MGTEASAANLLEESQIGTASSSGKRSLPWCIVISKLPKPTVNSILCFNDCVGLFENASFSWNGFAEFMGLKGPSQFPSIRPFLLDWAYAYIKDNIQRAFDAGKRPIDFFEELITYLKDEVFTIKLRLMKHEGRCAQFAIHFPFCREDVNNGPACFINSHFAFLRDPRHETDFREFTLSSIQKEFIKTYINLIPDNIIESGPTPFSGLNDLLANCFPLYRKWDEEYDKINLIIFFDKTIDCFVLYDIY